MKKRIAAAALVVSVIVMATAFATSAQAFPNKTSPCSNCHGTDSAVVVTATQTANNGTTATYAVSVNDAYGDGVTGWAVFDGSTNVANGYGPGTFSVAVGKTYKVFGVAGVGGAGSNSTNISPTAPVASDTTPPTVSITSPATGANVSGSVTIAATATDNTAVTSVQFSVDGTLLATDSSSPYSATWDASGAAPGSHTITVTAYDAAGNHASTARAVNVAAPADTTPPSVSITSPANDAVVSGSVNIAANATDAGGVATVQFYADGILISSDSSAPYTATWNTAGESSGAHTLEAKAIDGAGNSATASISVSIAPAPSSPTSVVTVSVTSSSAQTASTLGGARVVLRNSATGMRYKDVSDSSGTASFSALPYGTYQVIVSARGHKRSVSTLVVDTVAESVSVQLTAR